MKIFDSLFGNKVRIVTATKIEGFAKSQQEFLFHKDTCDEAIINFLWDEKRYRVEIIKNIRSKQIISPEENCFKSFSEEKIILFYD